MSPEPRDHRIHRHGALGAQSDSDRRTPTLTPGSAAAESWPRRLVRRLALLDSWTPETQHLSSPQAVRRHVRAEWTSSGDLTESQAAVLLALDETTAWKP